MTRTHLHILLVGILLTVGMFLVRLIAYATPPTGGYPIARVSLTNNENENAFISIDPAVNRAGRYVAFATEGELVPADTNATYDIYVRDTDMDTTTRISVSSMQTEGDSGSLQPDISESGQYIVFQSSASNLVLNDTNGYPDIFIRDRQLGTTTLLTLAIGGVGANNSSWDPAITDDGTYVAFISRADNLVPGDTNGVDDCFVVEVATGAISRVLTSTGAELNIGCQKVDISGDTPVIAFTTFADNVVPGDTNNLRDVFTVSVTNTNHQQISVDVDGNSANNNSHEIAISDSGNYVAFTSSASDLVADDTNQQIDVFVRDTLTQNTYLVSVNNDGNQSNSSASAPVISGNGQRIAFITDASNLVPNDTNSLRDVFVHDLGTGTTERLSVSALGEEANDFSTTPAISQNGRVVVFGSWGSNLVMGDTNNTEDIFKSDITLFPPPSTPTVTPTGTFYPPTETATPTVTPTGTFYPPTETATPTVTPTGTFYPPTETATPTVTPTGTFYPPTETPTPTVTPTGTFYPPTETATPTVTPTGTLSTSTPVPDTTMTPPPPTAHLFLPLVRH